MCKRISLSGIFVGLLSSVVFVVVLGRPLATLGDEPNQKRDDPPAKAAGADPAVVAPGTQQRVDQPENHKGHDAAATQPPARPETSKDLRPGPGRGMMGRGMMGPGMMGPGMMGRGMMGPGMMGQGPMADMRTDMDVFHYLLENHAKIRRSVTPLENGVETLTESDDPKVAAKIQEHAVAMHRRIQEGRGLRFWDELFAAIFQKHADIKMSVSKTAHGVKVRETSTDLAVVALIRAHAKVVSGFVARGFEEAQQNHPVPTAASAAAQPREKSASPAAAPPAPKLDFPIIANHGGVVPRTSAAEPPRAGAKVVFDVTADAKPTEVNKGLERAARMINLYGAAGLKARDVKIILVLHGEATKSVLNDRSYQERFEVERNPNLPLIRELSKHGVEVLVCGQALGYKGYPDADLADGVSIAAAALTALTNKQAEGYAYVPVP